MFVLSAISFLVRPSILSTRSGKLYDRIKFEIEKDHLGKVENQEPMLLDDSTRFPLFPIIYDDVFLHIIQINSKLNLALDTVPES